MDSQLEVPFFSLKEQHQPIKRDVLTAIEKLIDQSDFILGEEISGFEASFASFCESQYCVGVSNGTAALYLALKALNINDCDEVILPAATFSATADAISQLGAIPVFADICPNTWTIDPNSIAAKITGKTKALIVVHLYGNPCDMDGIRSVINGKNIALIEDAAQAHGAVYKGRAVGSLGDLACFSFYPSKNLGAMGDAGAIVSSKPELKEEIRAYRNCGKNNQGEQEFLGFNYRISSIQAAVLNVKLPYLKEWTKKRQAIASCYKENLKNSKLSVQSVEDENSSAYHLFVVKADNRERFVQHLEANNIGFSFHYKNPVHLLPAYESLGIKKGSLPVTEALFDSCVSIPLFPEMSEQQMEKVVQVLNAY